MPSPQPWLGLARLSCASLCFIDRDFVAHGIGSTRRFLTATPLTVVTRRRNLVNFRLLAPRALLLSCTNACTCHYYPLRVRTSSDQRIEHHCDKERNGPPPKKLTRSPSSVYDHFAVKRQSHHLPSCGQTSLNKNSETHQMPSQNQILR